jgi:peptidyl-prolyl cis-trans isomerase D
MLRFFGRFAKSWAGPVIGGVLLLAFGVLGSTSGIRNVFGVGSSSYVVRAGSHVVTENEFKQTVGRIEKQFEARTGQPYSPEEAIREGADKELLQEFAGEKAFAEMLTRSGVEPSDEVVARALKRQAETNPQSVFATLFDPVTGKYRKDGLAMLAAQNGLTVPEIQQELTDSFAEDDVMSAVGGGFALPKIYLAAQGALVLQGYDVTYFLIPQQDVPKPPAPSDAQLKAIIAQLNLKLPERRVLTVMRLSAKALAPTLPVSDADVAQQFAYDKNRLSKPELRSIVEIPLNDPSAAPRVAAALRKGQDPQAVAKSVGVDAINYVDQPQSGIADRKAAAAAFQMPLDQVSGPVQGDFKTVILKVTKITPAQVPDLATSRPQIEAELRQSRATDQVYDLGSKFQALRQSGASVADAAAKVGSPAVTIGPVTANGQIEGAGPNPMLSQKLLATAFQLPAGGDSDLEQDTDKGEYYAVHVDKVIPPAPRTLDEPGLRQQLIQYYIEQAIVSGEQALADKAKAAIDKGQSFEAAAAAIHAQVAHMPGLNKVAAQQYAQALGPKFLGAIFSAKPGQVFTDPTSRGFVVARLDAIHQADPGQLAALVAAYRAQFSQAYVRDLRETMSTLATEQIKPQTNLELAREAMGATPEIVARATAKPAKGAPGPAP